MSRRIYANAAHALGAMVLLMSMVFAGAVAQAQNRVEAQRDWAVFEAGDANSKVCWIATQPTKWTATRGGKRVSVNRGEIFLMVAVRPADGAKNEVSFIAGYPFKKGSSVGVKVGSKKFTLFTDEENAWLPGPAEDDEVVVAFKKGVSAVFEGVSARGTTTVDTFSLLGFTAALQSAQKRCK